ncbi:tyrosine-type recombinase/integrase [Sphingomonas sp. CFBP 8760]|uniref:tyrosine-type recombinase/integrase n=1 Tax=Sphingomonas sp. CFBP 8760 TaxID=2775282 RepID=UPI001782DE5A|nr:integrase arm-type DNA-binding domain-containing protein [Sphingomonas sp. CFBP 8760]MBD8547911.1 integrase arm-type DNA-binding domain-containing protein [Sphingomonas sp. CFBP 8760]
MLTNAAVRTARSRDRAYKISDGGGMYLHVLPSGSKHYRLKFYLAGRECVMTIGGSHEISLVDARARRDAARALVNAGQDPREAAVCGMAQVRNFEDAARAWHAHARSGWTEVHAGEVMSSLQRDVFPVIGAMPLAAITAPVVLAALRSIEGRGSIKTARRVRQRVGFIFDFAEAEGWTEGNPAEKTLRALAPAPAAGRQPAIVDAAELRELLAAAERAVSPATVKLASQFLALTAVRLAAVRGARWIEIEGLDGDAPVWRVPAARMKLAVAKKNDSTHDHLVPLSAAAIAVLHQARAIAGDAGLIFSGETSDAPIGEGAIGRLYMRAGFAGRHVPHGWRASFSTILNEAMPGERGAIDRALGHVGAGEEEKEEGINRGVEGAYNRAQHLPRRRRLFDEWASILMP